MNKGFDLRELLRGQPKLVHHEEEIDVLARDAAARKGLLAGQESLERRPLRDLVVVEDDLQVVRERVTQLGLPAQPRLELREHLAHRGLDFGVEPGVLRFVGELLGDLLHALAEERPALLLGHRSVRSLGFLGLLADLLHRVAHLLLSLGRRERAHEVAADLRHRGHDRLGLGLERRLVVDEELLEDAALVFGELELLDEDRDVASLEVRLERLAHIAHARAHAATAHHATAHAAEATTAAIATAAITAAAGAAVTAALTAFALSALPATVALARRRFGLGDDERFARKQRGRCDQCGTQRDVTDDSEGFHGYSGAGQLTSNSRVIG